MAALGEEPENDAEVTVKQVRKSSPKDETAVQKKITDTFIGSGILLSGQAAGVIKSKGIKPDKIISLAQEKGVFLVTKEFVEEFFPEETRESLSFVIRRGKPATASQIEANLVFDKDKDVTGQSTSEGTIENFIELFRDRYKRMKGILMNRASLRDAIDIGNLEKYRDQQVKVIGMIRELRRSKSGNLLIEIEDPTGNALVVDYSEAAQKKTILVNDEVIGVTGTVKGDLILAQEIIEPDIPMARPEPNCEDPISMAFLSDIHVGSLLFKEREFRSFIDWLNLSGSGNRREIAESIKYLFVAGDLVDGIGIYPGQEGELAIPDIYKQYDYFTRLFEQIPDYIEVIIAAGNHDAIRRAEPQPSLESLLEKLSEKPNIHLVGNPARVKAHGFEVLMYHGTSMDAMISSLSHLSYDKPERAQIEYLKKRHLSPIYGTKEQIAPEERDFMAIDFVPDIFHCGHVHKNGYATYRGVKVINSGTWQAQTDFQQQQGHMPTPCQVPVLDMQSNQLKVLSFG
jgi:DNA polymerase II small subunit